MAAVKKFFTEFDSKMFFRITNVRILSQIFFFSLFVISVWLTWTSRLEGYPVSRILEFDPLVMGANILSTGYVYRYLGWGMLIIVLTLLFGRVFCNWICPYGTLHQFVAWLFDNRQASKRIEQNRYHKAQYLKYSILIVFLLMSAMGALQIGLLDPIVMMYRAMATFFAPMLDTAVGRVSGAAEGVNLSVSYLDSLKFAPGVESRIFVGSFWIGVIFLFFVLMNLWKPRFFCRFVCPLGALLGVVAGKSPSRSGSGQRTATAASSNSSIAGWSLRCDGASEARRPDERRV